MNIPKMKMRSLILRAAMVASLSCSLRAEMAGTNQPSPLLSKPLSLLAAQNLALDQNGAILRGKSDLEAQYGVVVQTRAIAIPKLTVSGQYQATTETEQFPFPNAPAAQDQSWNAQFQVVQAIYQGGQIRSALRTAKLTKEQALLQYRTVIADALLQVRVAYYDVLLATEQIEVEEASVKLLTQQLDDQTKRNQAGTVPRFNVLQAEVELANEKPRLIRARNAYRVAKNNLVNQLGYRVPPEVSEDLPLQLTDKLDSDPYTVELPTAVSQALQYRTEMQALSKQQRLREESVVTAKAGYKPTFSLFGGYGARNSQFNNDLTHAISGWTGGAQVSWNLFDGLLTQGRIEQAQALYAGSKVDVENEARSIELEVRTDYSNFIEAREVLESQKLVQEEADEALRLAIARNEAGTSTQLDVLSAQTSLTQARSTQVQALHDYDVARARLERAIGLKVTEISGK